MEIEVKSRFPGDGDWGEFDSVWAADNTEDGLMIQCGTPDYQATIPTAEKARFIKWIQDSINNGLDGSEFEIGNDDCGASFNLSSIEMRDNKTRVYMTYSSWSEFDFFAERGWDSEEDILLEDFKVFVKKLQMLL
jgi:hypothetical protein